MRYILAFIAPPFALLICRKPFQFILNLIFWLASFPLIFVGGLGFIVWLICAAHALIVCRTAFAEAQVGKIVNAIQSQNAAIAAAQSTNRAECPPETI
ncbi:MAG: hypothetical protein JWN24_1263 [Phycisphaerales bacterium]|nr:hypothetical protein [Phycisphaerales bacterium]